LGLFFLLLFIIFLLWLGSLFDLRLLGDFLSGLVFIVSLLFLLFFVFLLGLLGDDFDGFFLL
jgi:hypothetical protein